MPTSNANHTRINRTDLCTRGSYSVHLTKIGADSLPVGSLLQREANSPRQNSTDEDSVAPSRRALPCDACRAGRTVAASASSPRTESQASRCADAVTAVGYALGLVPRQSRRKWAFRLPARQASVSSHCSGPRTVMPLATAPRSQHLDDLTKRLRDVLWRHCDRTATALVEEQEEPVFWLSDETANLLLDLAENRRQTGRTQQGLLRPLPPGPVEPRASRFWEEPACAGRLLNTQWQNRSGRSAAPLRQQPALCRAARLGWHRQACIASRASRSAARAGRNRLARTGSSSVPCHNL